MYRNLPIFSAVALLVSANTAANADVEIFDNRDLSFMMNDASGIFPEDTEFTPFNVMKSAGEQRPAMFGMSFSDLEIGEFAYVNNVAESSSSPSYFDIYPHPSVQVATADPLAISHAGDSLTIYPVLDAHPGLVIDSSVSTAHPLPKFSARYDGSSVWPAYELFLPDEFTAALKVDLDDGTHYGFVHFVRYTYVNFPFPTSFTEFQPVRWGFETTPDTPLVVPAFCPADMDADGDLDFFDAQAFLAAFNTGSFAADYNRDGEWNFFDVSMFITDYLAGCP